MRTELIIPLVIGAICITGIICETVSKNQVNDLDKQNAKLNHELLDLHDRLGVLQVENESLKQDIMRLQGVHND